MVIHGKAGRRRAAAAGLVLALSRPAAGNPEPLTVRAGPASGAVQIANRSAHPVTIRTAITVEGYDGARWKPVATEMNLVRACDPDGLVGHSPASTTLPARSVVTPPPWRGWSCSGQCNDHCRLNTYWGAGPWRFRLTRDGGDPVYSNIFRMPASPTSLGS